MKTKEEIDTIAWKFYVDKDGIVPNTYEREGFTNGYTQCQEDNSDKKYTEQDIIWTIQEAYGHGQNDEFDGVNKIEESIRVILKSLNKQE